MSFELDTDPPCELRQRSLYRESQRLPALLLAYSSEPSQMGDRFCLTKALDIGRNKDKCDIHIPDSRLSKRHFRISPGDDEWHLTDVGSSNGTFVNGRQVEGVVSLPDVAIIAAGRCVFVYHRYAQKVFQHPPKEYGIVGAFHVASIIEDLTKCRDNEKHILLTGPSGSGKELAANALASILGAPGTPQKKVNCNAASFATIEQSKIAIFGVVKNVFTGVNPQRGLIMAAGNGLLFLDEMHSLPEEVQRALLRLIETGEFNHVGDETVQKTNVRLVLATNIDDENAGLLPDLYARLRVVNIPSLSKRAADIPVIFNHVLRSSGSCSNLGVAAQDAIFNALEGEHYEILCLNGFEAYNVRGIMTLCDAIVSDVLRGVDAIEAVDSQFSTQFPNSPVYARKSNQTKKKVSSLPVPSIPPNIAKPQQNANRVAESHLQTTLHVSEGYESLREQIIAIFQDKEKGNGKYATTANIVRKMYNVRATRSTIERYLLKWGVVGR